MAYVPGVFTVAELTCWYESARRAYQELLTGSLVVETMVDGYMAKFARPDADKLRAYIDRLAAEIAGRARPSGISVTF